MRPFAGLIMILLSITIFSSRLESLTEISNNALDISTERAYKDFFPPDSEIVFLDIREDFEVSNGIIEGAVWLPLGTLRVAITERFPDREGQGFIVYCRSGNRSMTGARILRELGYVALSMNRGFLGWQSMDYPTSSFE
jgi:rhodanese-related sulfurtransferase